MNITALQKLFGFVKKSKKEFEETVDCSNMRRIVSSYLNSL